MDKGDKIFTSLIVVSTLLFFLGFGLMITIDTSIRKKTTILVSNIEVSWEPLVFSRITTITAYSGCTLKFWGDLSNDVKAGGQYELKYRVRYFGFLRYNVLMLARRL